MKFRTHRWQDGTFSCEYSVELDDAQALAVSKELGRTLTQDECDCLTLTLTGRVVAYMPATRDNPSEGGYAEDLIVTLDGVTVTLFDDDDKTQSDMQDTLMDAWGKDQAMVAAAWEDHEECLAKERFKGIID